MAQAGSRHFGSRRETPGATPASGAGREEFCWLRAGVSTGGMLDCNNEAQQRMLKPDVTIFNAPASMTGVCLAHHWLLNMRGGERVLEQIAAHFPDAPLFTLAAMAPRLSATLRAHHIVTPPLLDKPWAAQRVRALLPWHPTLARSLRLPADCRLLVSSDAGLIKCIRAPVGAAHVCYCHSPPRYLWDENVSASYTAGRSFAALFLRRMAPALRREDRAAAQRVDAFLCNSEFVANRIAKHYGRPARVIHPGVNTAAFNPRRERDAPYAAVGELTAYKRMDLAVQACNMLRRPLIVVGDGPEIRRLKRSAGPTVCFAGRLSDAELHDLLERCRALLFPQIEDFGIIAVEAQAAGAPVLAFRGGGALEIVEEGRTGLFFETQNATDLARIIVGFESANFDPQVCAHNARRFSAEAFHKDFYTAIEDLCGNSPTP